MDATADTLPVRLAYGRGHLTVSLPVGRTEVMEPLFQPGLPNERTAVEQALASPIGTRPLVEWLKPGSRICIVFTDITRATPNERIIPWILEALTRMGVKDSQITLLNATGTHRGNTPAELETMLTKAAGLRLLEKLPPPRSITQSERLSKYNRLLEIEAETHLPMVAWPSSPVI